MNDTEWIPPYWIPKKLDDDRAERLNFETMHGIADLVHEAIILLSVHDPAIMSLIRNADERTGGIVRSLANTIFDSEYDDLWAELMAIAHYIHFGVNADETARRMEAATTLDEFCEAIVPPSGGCHV